MEEQVLLDLLNSHPNGLDNRGWDYWELSRNPSLPQEYVESNLDKDWHQFNLLSNPNLSSEFRLEIVKRIEDPQEYDAQEDIIPDQSIIDYMLEHEEFNHLVDLLGGNPLLTHDQFENLYHHHQWKIDWNHALEECSAENYYWFIKEYSRCQINNLPYPRELSLHSFHNNNTSNDPKLIRETNEVMFNLIEDLDNLVARGWNMEDLLIDSTHIRITKRVLEKYPELLSSKRALQGLDKPVLDEQLIDDLINQNIQDMRSLVRNPVFTISNLIHLIGAYPSDNEILLEEVIRSYLKYKEIDIQIIRKLSELKVNLSTIHHLIPSVLREDLSSIKWKLGYYELSITVSSLQDLQIISTLNLDNCQIKCSPDIESIQFISDNKEIIERINWRGMSKIVHQDIIISYIDLPWDNWILSSRKYYPSKRLRNTKRAR